MPEKTLVSTKNIIRRISLGENRMFFHLFFLDVIFTTYGIGGFMTIKKLHSLAVFLIVVLAGTLGCQSTNYIFKRTVPIQIVPTDTVPVEVDPVELEATLAINEQRPGEEIGFLTYENPDYGFQFDYPTSWALTEVDHMVVLTKGPNRLAINFRWLDEQDVIFRSGMGAGDIHYIGKLNFMGQILPIQALVFEEKTKVVLFSDTGTIEAGDLVFMITLEDLETNYADIELSSEVIDEAIEILASFR
jgi:hypothetical protein